MADEVREIQFNFAADVGDIIGQTDAVSMGMAKATGNLSLAEQAMGAMATSGKKAAIQAGAMAVEWVAASADIAFQANRTAGVLDTVLGESVDVLSDSIENLAGHMGLAEHEAQAVLLSAAQLGTTMGMTEAEAAEFANTMFILAGDMAAANPTLGSAADAMEALTKASNGATRGMLQWNVSLKASEVDAKALEMTGKELSSELTQQEKAMATLALTTDKTASAQGVLNEKIESGSTATRDAKATIKDIQKQMGDALMPLKKLTWEGFKILADVLTALAPTIDAVGVVLQLLFEIIEPLLPIVTFLAELLGERLTKSIELLMRALEPLLKLLVRIAEGFMKVTSAAKNAMSALNPFSGGFSMPSFHSGGTVPGATGTLQPIMAQGGETIGRPGTQGAGGGGGGGGQVINITVQAGVSSPMDTARTIADLLTEYSQAQGALNIRIAGE